MNFKLNLGKYTFPSHVEPHVFAMPPFYPTMTRPGILLTSAPGQAANALASSSGGKGPEASTKAKKFFLNQRSFMLDLDFLMRNMASCTKILCNAMQKLWRIPQQKVVGL